MSIELARRAAAGDIDPEVLIWVQTGLAKYLEGAAVAQALGLDRASRVRARDAALREAAALLDDGRGPWALAERLEVAVLRFESRVWPRVRHQLVPDLAPTDAALFRAFAADVRMRRCQRALYELIAE